MCEYCRETHFYESFGKKKRFVGPVKCAWDPLKKTETRFSQKRKEKRSWTQRKKAQSKQVFNLFYLDFTLKLEPLVLELKTNLEGVGRNPKPRIRSFHSLPNTWEKTSFSDQAILPTEVKVNGVGCWLMNSSIFFLTNELLKTWI